MHKKYKIEFEVEIDSAADWNKDEIEQFAKDVITNDSCYLHTWDTEGVEYCVKCTHITEIIK